MTEFSDFDRKIMERCFHLASLGGNKVKANPLVGAVITYEGRIIGEGFHRKFGGPHAEVNAIKSVSDSDKNYLKHSHIYISLEPCNHVGKTPPCSDLIIKSGIPKVTICNLDPNPSMQGKSITLLENSGIKVRLGLLSQEGKLLNQKFFANHQSGIPQIILKWAQSKDGYFGQRGKQVWLTNERTRLLTHRWRQEVDGIMVGTETVIVDDPSLNNRLASGKSPQRIILDRKGRLQKGLKVFTDPLPTCIITSVQNYGADKDLDIIHIPEDEWHIEYMMKKVYKKGICTLMIEGGARLLNSFIKEGLWHEARVLHSPILLQEGFKAPLIKGKIREKYNLDTDKVFIISNLQNVESI